MLNYHKKTSVIELKRKDIEMEKMKLVTLNGFWLQVTEKLID